MSVIRMVFQHFGSVPSVLLVHLLLTSCCFAGHQLESSILDLVYILVLSARLISEVSKKKIPLPCADM